MNGKVSLLSAAVVRAKKRLVPLGEGRSDFFNLDPQRWAGSGGVCGFRAECQRKALLISILFCRALLQRKPLASRLPFSWRVVKDYEMITRRNLVPSK
jgi:hypothetical protein